MRTLETTINADQLKDHIGALLYTLGLVKDNEEIIKLETSQLGELIPLKLTIRREQEVTARIHHA